VDFPPRPIVGQQKDRLDKEVKEYVKKLQASLEPPKTLGERASFWWALKRVAAGTSVVELIFAVERVISTVNEECQIYMVRLFSDARPVKTVGFEEDQVIAEGEPDPWTPKSRGEVKYAWLIEKFIL
jgi:hypothetical protein